jgi:ATP-binding cassette subfamily B protein/subfamily B ATP-binding cassette protein MsbA
MSIPRILTTQRRMMLARLVGIGFAQAGMTIATALLIQYAFDRWVTPADADIGIAGLAILLALLAATGVHAWLRLRERVEAERLGQSYAYAVRLALYDRLGALPPRALQRRSRGGNLLRFVGDLTALRQWVSLGLARLSVATTVTMVAVTALGFINLALAGAVAVVLICGASSAYYSGRSMQGAVRESRRRRARLAANVNEQLTSMPVVQVFDQVDRERSRLRRQSRRLYDAMIDRSKIIGRMRAVTEATSGIAAATVLMLGAFEVSQGRASAGAVVAAMSVLTMLVPALRDLGRIHEYWHGYSVSLEKIRSFMQTPALVNEPPDASPLSINSGGIELADISLDGVLDGLSASAPAGSVVSIIGPNGSGKSTLLNLVARLTDPDHGRVMIDNLNIAEHSLASIRRHIGMVSPDLPLMRGSLERNLRYRCPGASADELRRVYEMCGVDEVIAALPNGLQTRIKEGGINLSLGQRQRIALARALLGDPKILLLDEADANLDPPSVAVLERVLANYQGTVLFVTHRVERIMNSDLLWYVDSGRVAQSGPPARLLQEHGPAQLIFGGQLALAA